MDDSEEERQADTGVSILEGMADAWAAEVNLMAMVKNVASPRRLHRGVPQADRERAFDRMEQQIDAVVRQAFIEGAYRALTGLKDEQARAAQRDESR